MAGCENTDWKRSRSARWRSDGLTACDRRKIRFERRDQRVDSTPRRRREAPDHARDVAFVYLLARDFGVAPQRLLRACVDELRRELDNRPNVAAIVHFLQSFDGTG